jgi:hypothetical protein
MMDPGKDIPGKEDKGRGKDAAKGATADPDDEEDDKKKGVENPGRVMRLVVDAVTCVCVCVCVHL